MVSWHHVFVCVCVFWLLESGLACVVWTNTNQMGDNVESNRESDCVCFCPTKAEEQGCVYVCVLGIERSRERSSVVLNRN